MGGVLSFNSVKMVGCIVGLPILLAVAVKLQPATGVQVVFWLIALALVIGVFKFMKDLLVERGQPWTFMVPGSLMLGGAAFVVALILIIGGGSDQPMALYVALLLAGFIGALWYNVRGLGPGDGFIITLMQACLALIIVAVVVFWQFYMPKGRRR